jgi:hypothetical protein
MAGKSQVQSRHFLVWSVYAVSWWWSHEFKGLLQQLSYLV